MRTVNTIQTMPTDVTPQATPPVLVSHALLQLGHHPAAHRVAQRALARWPTDADACLATANTELALGLHAQAERRARAAPAATPSRLGFL